MSVHTLSIPDFGKKLDILLHTGVQGIRTASELSRQLDIGPDILSRMRKGSRRIPQRLFAKLCQLYEIKETIWFAELNSFGRHFGLTPHEVASVTGVRIPGIDFSSRITDRRMITDIHEVIRGYWCSYYYSVSKLSDRLVSRDLCIIKEINDDGFIECEVIDSHFRYAGHCFPIKGMLYFILEKSELYNEIIVYATNLPDRTPPKLNGIVLCLSGGVDETTTHPSASKVAFRYIGKEEDIHRLYDIGDQPVEAFLRRKIPAYLNPEQDRDLQALDIYCAIDNGITDETVPFALRAT